LIYYRNIIKYFLDIGTQINVFKNIISDELYQAKIEYEKAYYGKYDQNFIYNSDIALFIFSIYFNKNYFFNYKNENKKKIKMKKILMMKKKYQYLKAMIQIQNVLI